MVAPFFIGKGKVMCERDSYGNRWVAGFYMKVGSNLAPREAEVLRMIADGANSEEIGSFLGISRRTVDVYRTRVLARLNARSSAHAVSLAYRKGLLSLEGPET